MLDKLIFYHGRLNILRNQKLILIIFYKTFSLIFINTFYSLFCNLEFIIIIPELSFTLNNILLTTILPIVKAVYEIDRVYYEYVYTKFGFQILINYKIQDLYVYLYQRSKSFDIIGPHSLILILYYLTTDVMALIILKNS